MEQKFQYQLQRNNEAFWKVRLNLSYAAQADKTFMSEF